jgi:pimeloyl-ACP methyl ester carboxylesterase
MSNDTTTGAIHVTRLGSGTPVLMVHGSGQGNPLGGAQHWACQAPLAEQGFELILPDRPGHGRSPTRGPEDFEVDAVWVAEMLGDGAHLVGHSYGGVIALAAAGLRPEAVRSLTLVEAPVFSAAAGDPDAEEFAGQIAAAAAIEDPFAAVVEFTKVAGIPVGLGRREPPSLEQLQAMGKGFQTMRPPYDWDAADAIARVRAAGIPALIVTGGWSPGFKAIGDALAQQLGGEHLIIDAGHHFPHMVADADGNPVGAEFTAALRAFVSGS